MTEYINELINIIKELPKVFLFYITILTFFLFYGFYTKKLKKAVNEVYKNIYE